MTVDKLTVDGRPELGTKKTEHGTKISSRFHPAYSLLGRWIRLRVRDRRRAESLFIVVSGVIALALVLSQFLGWAMLQPEARGLTFALFQVLLAGLYALVCLVGRQPEIRVTLNRKGIEITRRTASTILPWRLSRSEETAQIDLREIVRVTTISAELYYRHYARYASTRAFVNRIPPKLLMIELHDGPVIFGLAPSDLVTFLEALEERTTSASRVA